MYKKKSNPQSLPDGWQADPFSALEGFARQGEFAEANEKTEAKEKKGGKSTTYRGGFKIR